MATIGGGGGVLDILHHLILPTLALGLFYAAIYTRVMVGQAMLASSVLAPQISVAMRSPAARR